MLHPDADAEVCQALGRERGLRYECVDGVCFPVRSGPDALILAARFVRLFQVLPKGYAAGALDVAVRTCETRLHYPEGVVYLTTGANQSAPTREPVVIMEVGGIREAQFDAPAVRFDAYKRIPSLRHFVLVDRRCARVYHWRPCDDGRWRVEIHIRRHPALHNPLEIVEFGVSATLDDLYAGTDVPDQVRERQS